MPKQRVVVLGGNGFVGSAILRHLDPQIYQCVSVTRKECDFTDAACPAVLKSLLREGDIIVCAAAKAPAKNLEMLTENITLIAHIAEALRETPPAYVLNISSDAVYGDSMKPLNEQSIPAPLNTHGIMHCMREYILEKTVAAPLGHLRPTLIYGEDDPHNGYGPNSFLRLAKDGKDIMLFGNGEERRDHIYVGDVAKLAVGMLGGKKHGAVNAVTGEVVSFMEIAQWVKAAAGGRIAITSKPRSGPMPHNGYRAFDNTAARQLCPGLAFQTLGNYLQRSVDRKHAV